MRKVLWVMVLVGCTHPDPGISREQAENILRDFGLQDFNLGPHPDGWEGTADWGPGTYTIKIKVDRRGLITWPYEQSN